MRAGESADNCLPMTTQSYSNISNKKRGGEGGGGIFKHKCDMRRGNFGVLTFDKRTTLSLLSPLSFLLPPSPSPSPLSSLFLPSFPLIFFLFCPSSLNFLLFLYSISHLFPFYRIFVLFTLSNTFFSSPSIFSLFLTLLFSFSPPPSYSSPSSPDG